MTSSASLRDLYTDPSTAWNFVPPAAQNGSAAPASAPASSSASYQWTTRPAQNSIFELAPSLDPNDPGYDVSASLVLKSLVASALLQYTSTAIAMPFEVGKMLLQVQWVPREAGEPDTPPEMVEVEEEISDSSSETESYFADPNAGAPSRYPAPRIADDKGYVLRRSVLEEGTRPEYIIPVGSADGVWGMIKRIARFKPEGWLALWKGLLTSCIHDVLSTTIQPLLHNLLQSIFAPSLTPFQQPPLLLPVASHLITGFLLSPLDLIRTRLVVQSFQKRHRTYSGPFDALSQILQHEGGVRGLYLHPHLLYPTLIDNVLRPLVSLALPRYLGATHIGEDTHPVAWLLADFAGSCVGLLVTLPFETVRRRLQAQVRGSANSLKACVEMRPAPYNGVVDTLWHILTEERSDLPLKRQRRTHKGDKGKEKAPKDASVDEDDDGSFLRNTGIGQLYRGLGMKLGASVIVLVLGLLTGREERDAGWAEL